MMEWAVLPLTLGGVSLALSHFGWTDRAKMEKIFENCGLVNKEGKKLQLYRKTKNEWGYEYAFKIPLGLSAVEIEKKFDNIQDGLNNKIGGIQKYIEMDYDGMLRIQVYEQGIPKLLKFEDDLSETNDFKINMGLGYRGDTVHDFTKTPHMIVAGTTRYGKTMFLRYLICSLVRKCPSRSEFAMFDLKGGLELGEFEKMRQTASVSVDVYDSLEKLSDIKQQVSERLRIFRQRGYRNINDDKKGEFKRVFVIVDEAAELASKGYKREEYKIRQECESHLAYIARVAGALGFHLVFCTQYPTFDVLPRQIKQNTDAKLCFRLQTKIASEVVLDQSGAEKLPHGLKGRALYLTDKLEEIQVPLVSDQQVKQIIKENWKNEQHYDEGTKAREDINVFRRNGLRID